MGKLRKLNVSLKEFWDSLGQFFERVWDSLRELRTVDTVWESFKRVRER